MAIFVMVYDLATGKPHTFYEWQNPQDGNTPPWGFSGYALLDCTTKEGAKQEFESLLETWYLCQGE